MNSPGSSNNSSNRINLFGKTQDELAIIANDHGLPGYTARQISSWLYKKHCDRIEEMTNLSLPARQSLEAACQIRRGQPIEAQTALDGTVKYLFAAEEQKAFEAVWLPEETRGTLCLSTQSGCRMGCHFCMTGRQGAGHNLSAGEILNQYASNPFRDRITNIVYMGMGEPLDNLEQTLKSLEIFTEPWGYAMSPTRITLSTIGVLPGLKRFLDESRCHLAISLHAPHSTERSRLMPVEKTWPISGIIQLLRGRDWSGQRRLSFEYIMFKDINDAENQARDLAKLLGGLECRINLLQYHALPDSELQGSPRPRMEAFQEILKSRGFITTIRKSRGQDILAACGLLSTTHKTHKSKSAP